MAQLAESGARVRAFDQRAGGSRKLVLLDSKYGVGIERDLAVRRDLLARAAVRHPAVHHSARDDTHVFLTEALVQGRRFSPHLDVRHIRESLADPLSRLYEAAGVCHLPVAEAIGNGLAGQILDLAPETAVVAHAQAVIRQNPVIAAGFSHGDLLPSNLAVDRADVVFLDLETAGYAPIGSDLLRFWRKYPRTRALLRGAGKLIDRHQDRHLNLRDTASLQLAIGLLAPSPKRTRAAQHDWSKLA